MIMRVGILSQNIHMKSEADANLTRKPLHNAHSQEIIN